MVSKKILPKNRYFTFFKDSISYYRNNHLILTRLTDGQEVFICINNGIEPKTDGYCGLKVVRALEAAERSSEKDGEVIIINDGK